MQRRIAAILDAADSLRAKRRAAVAKLDQLAQSIFIDMFGDPAAECQIGERIKIREALERKLITDLQDGNHGEKHPKVSDFTESGIPFVTANCVSDGLINVVNAYKLADEWLRILRIGFAKSGDVLLTHKGTVGEVAVVPANLNTLILSPQVTYYRLSNSISNHYLAGYLRLPIFKA